MADNNTSKTSITLSSTANAAPSTVNSTSCETHGFRAWWDNLAKPQVVDPQKRIDKIVTDSRDQIAMSLIFAIAVIGLMVAGKLPTLFGLCGIVEVIGLIAYHLSMREAVNFGRNLEETDRRTSRAMGRLLCSFFIWVLLLTILAFFVNTGRLNTLVEVFPLLDKFSDWQIEQVNELFEFFEKLF